MHQSRQLKHALTKALQRAAKLYLVDERGSDLPDDLLALDDYEYEIQPLAPTQFVVRATPVTDDGARVHKPAMQFEVTITGSSY